MRLIDWVGHPAGWSWHIIECECLRVFTHHGLKWWPKCPACGRTEHLETVRLTWVDWSRVHPSVKELATR